MFVDVLKKDQIHPFSAFTPHAPKAGRIILFDPVFSERPGNFFLWIISIQIRPWNFQQLVIYHVKQWEKRALVVEVMNTEEFCLIYLLVIV